MAERDGETAPSRSLIRIAWDAVKIVGAGLLAAAGYYGTDLDKKIQPNAVTVGLAAALLVSVLIIWKLQTSGVKGYGLLRAFPERDRSALEWMLKALRRAKTIRMLGFNLRASGLKSGSEFDRIISARLKAEKDLSLRILIADPEIDSLRRRDEQESRPQKAFGRMKTEITDVTNYIENLRERTSSTVQVKFVDAEIIRGSIIIADETMLATWYLSSRRGSTSPTFEIYGHNSPFFEIFDGEFEQLWQQAKDLKAAAHGND